MTQYNVEYSFQAMETGSVDLEADDREQAEEFAAEWVRESFEEATNIVIETVKEIKINAS